MAVLASIFAGQGGYASPQDFADDLVPGIWVGSVLVGFGALAATIPGRRAAAGQSPYTEPYAEPYAEPVGV